MKQELRSAKFLCNEIDNGNVCPACPKVNSLFVHSKYYF